jgi:hypothetical protein
MNRSDILYFIKLCFCLDYSDDDLSLSLSLSYIENRHLIVYYFSRTLLYPPWLETHHHKTYKPPWEILDQICKDKVSNISTVILKYVIKKIRMIKWLVKFNYKALSMVCLCIQFLSEEIEFIRQKKKNNNNNFGLGYLRFQVRLVIGR